jgi:C_GCAxxG_C_C family probable redox protein
MSPSADAVARFAQGCSCSQAVLAAYASAGGLDESAALRIAAGFGGGMGRLGHTCGAVTGAIMVLGLRHGSATMAPKAKQAIYARVREFTSRFQQRHGSIVCRELLSGDFGSPDGGPAGPPRQKCSTIVQHACEILDELL